MRPVITFHEDAETVEITLADGAYDNSEMHGTHTIHYAAGKVVAIEIHDAIVLGGESEKIGEFGNVESAPPSQGRSARTTEPCDPSVFGEPLDSEYTVGDSPQD